MSSKAEKEYKGRLERLEKFGRIRSFSQWPAAMQLDHGMRWKVDFLVILNDGREVYVEVKGGLVDRNYVEKLAAWRRERPGILLVVRKKGYWFNQVGKFGVMASVLCDEGIRYELVEAA